jgi:cysteine synthase A
MGKCENMNPGASVKDRAALWIIEEAERKGEITPGVSTLVEATGGNTGIGLGIVAAIKGYKTICTLPSKTSAEKVENIASYGVETIICPVVDLTDERHFVHVAKKIANENENHLYTNQFHNTAN